ncbi:MAG: 2-C-methyl-D-erythritol 4-phosphate cytidylyltransferase, partial [Vibrionaceae bacterium]
MNNMVNNKGSGADLRQITAIVPAAGVGARMPSYCPKQYRLLDEKTVLEHTVNMLCAHPQVTEVVVAISRDDGYFARTSLAHKAHVRTVVGGSTRAESVLAALVTATTPWVMVHDAARPCVTHADIDKLITCAQAHPHDGAILAVLAKDTMKQAQSGADAIATTIDRSLLWHALTPQMFMRETLLEALLHAQAQQLQVTDEASALELRG